MQKSFKKAIAVLMTVLMVISISPISAFAADTLLVTEDTGIDTQYYSFKLYHNNDYIINVLEGVSKDKVITVTQGETATIVMDASNNYYGDTSDYCISTDEVFTLTGDNITADVSGFGSQKRDNNSGYGNGQSNTEIKTTFTIDTTNLEATEYDLTLTYRYQMKKYELTYKGYKWSAKKELSSSVSNIRLVVEPASEPDTTTTALGGSIRIGEKSGMRFGFSTTAASDEVEEYGFLYAYEATDDLTLGKDGVKKKVADNHLDHGDYTTFNLVFTKVPIASRDTVISVRSYVIINGEYHYSPVVQKSFNQIANEVLDDPDVDSTTKDAINELLNEQE
jgi:hypothetical protein